MASLSLRHARAVLGRHYKTPKELWGFRLSPIPGTPQAVARRVLAANSERLGLDTLADDLECRRVIASLGGWHVIFGQAHLGRRIHRAYVTVHMNAERAVYLVKNRAVPVSLLPKAAEPRISRTRARELAIRAIRRGSQPIRTLEATTLWYPLRTRLHLAYKFRLHRRMPAEDWLVYIEAMTGAVLSKYDNVAEASGRATVFDPNPVVALGTPAPLLGAGGRPVRRVPEAAYRAVRLDGVSRGGTLDGPRVTTAKTKHRLECRDLDFRRLSHQPGFEEVMAYFHLDQAVRYVESLGYRGRRRIFTERVQVDARATREDNSFYNPGTRALGFGTGDVDDAEDGETILHEFGHALQDAICPDFGQSAEAAAMGEGFGDYFAASFFAGRKPAGDSEMANSVMTWDGILGTDPSDPGRLPCVRRVDSPLTFEGFDHSASADEHANGEIWSATLWEIWQALGRAIADRLIVESHFQLDGFTTFARGARAILDADRNLYGGQHLRTLRPIFRRRGIGPIE